MMFPFLKMQAYIIFVLQVCFQSLFEAGPPLSTAPPVLRFLLPSGRHVGAKALNISTTTATTFINSQLPGSLLPLEYIGSNSTLERLISASDILEPLVQPLFGKSIKLLTQVLSLALFLSCSVVVYKKFVYAMLEVQVVYVDFHVEVVSSCSQNSQIIGVLLFNSMGPFVSSWTLL